MQFMQCSIGPSNLGECLNEVTANILFTSDIWWFYGFLTWHKLLKTLNWLSPLPFQKIVSMNNEVNAGKVSFFKQRSYLKRRRYTLTFFNQLSLSAHEIESHYKGWLSLGILLIWKFWEKSLETFSMVWGNLRVVLMIPNLKRPYKPFIWILPFYRRNRGRRDSEDLTIKSYWKQPTELEPYQVLFASCTKGCFKSLFSPSSWVYQLPLHSQQMNRPPFHRKNRNCKTKNFSISCYQLWMDSHFLHLPYCERQEEAPYC